MTTAEILSAATPRPWGDEVWANLRSALSHKDSSLVLLAVNSLEEQEALIGELVQALERVLNGRIFRECHCSLDSDSPTTTDYKCTGCEVRAALAKAKQREVKL